MGRRALLVVNPISGRGRAVPAAERFAAAYRAAGGAIEERPTAAAGDAGRFAAGARAGGFDAVVAAGGDGTVNEVLNGLEGSGLPVGILAAGTANILAREFGIPFDPEDAARVVAHGKERTLDVGEARTTAGTRRFLCCAGAGIDGAVVHRIAAARQGGLGFRGWVRPIWTEIRAMEFAPLRTTVDGSPAAAATTAVVCNTANWGGLFTLVPGADPGDGALDAFLLDARSRRSFFRYIWGAWRGTLPRHRDVATVRGRVFRVEADRAVPVEVDGDPFGATPMEVTVRPAAAKVLVPEEDGR